MIKNIIISESTDFDFSEIGNHILTPDDFIKNINNIKGLHSKTKVINLCKSYNYLSKGYYVSLLADAKGLKCIPSVDDIVKVNWKRNYEFALTELNSILNKHFKEEGTEPLIRVYTSFFGRHENINIEPLSRKLFDIFRFPILSFEIEYTKNNTWEVNKIETQSITDLNSKRLEFFTNSIKEFTGAAWREKNKNKKQEKYWIGILHDPNEKLAPSNKGALKRFIKVGKQMNLWVELITKQDFSSLLEFDAIFIRETTAVNNHTFRFATKAESEDIPCMDDTQSIIKCCNKVFLHELMEVNKIPTPKTMILDKKTIDSLIDQITYPCVLKIPDGSFSVGVAKVNNVKEMKKEASDMLKKSDIILCQEFIVSEFDWRIGVLNGKALYANKYYMAKDHWQIYNHDAKSKKLVYGSSECVDLKDVPKNILDTAIKACKKIGNNLYGVDIKQLKDGSCVLIEVNDNPNIDEGVEDCFLGDKLYEKILQHLVHLIEN